MDTFLYFGLLAATSTPEKHIVRLINISDSSGCKFSFFSELMKQLKAFLRRHYMINSPVVRANCCWR